MKYKIGNVEVEAVQYNGENIEDICDIVKVDLILQSLLFQQDEWIVVSGLSIFVLSEQDFNNMATKVKEPKFKVGDKVYISDSDDDSVECFRYFIDKVCCEGDVIHYHLKDYPYKVFRDYELFTLEEAIEKLKEL